MSLEEIFSGASFDMEINKQVICPVCRGSGAKSHDDVKDCHSCHGNGVKIVRHQIAPGMFQQVQVECDVCRGKGKIIKSKCPHCQGSKVKRGSHEITVTIERGVPNGQKIVFDGEADESPDASAGNLVLVVVTDPHPIFTRIAHNLYMTETISLQEALLGFKRSIKHLDGSLVKFSRTSVTVPGI